MGKFAVGVLVVLAVATAVAVYYFQVRHYYVEVDAETAEVRMTSLVSGEAEPILIEGFQGIDADSSPLRYRACFRTPLSIATLTETFEISEDAEPLTGPDWFDCYDAREIGEAITAGEAVAFVGERSIAEGVDRIIAVFPDGQAFAWNQLNAEYRD